MDQTRRRSSRQCKVAELSRRAFDTNVCLSFRVSALTRPVDVRCSNSFVDSGPSEASQPSCAC